MANTTYLRKKGHRNDDDDDGGDRAVLMTSFENR
jgi:hypothetical protein